MTECNSCGQCCEVVALSYDANQADLYRMRGEIPADEATWAKTCLVPMSRRTVNILQPHYLDRNTIPPPWMVTSGEVGLMPYFYTCKKWDPQTRLCTDYENRPSPCRAFPWYDSEPNPVKSLPPQCAFRADIGLDVEVPVKIGPKP